MKVFLDDVREAPDSGWEVVRTCAEAIELLRAQRVEHISLDHDLGLDGDAPDIERMNKNGTGFDVLNYIEEALYFQILKKCPIIEIHSQNYDRRPHMEKLAKRLMEEYR